jgi:hypothetical protein
LDRIAPPIGDPRQDRIGFPKPGSWRIHDVIFWSTRLEIIWLDSSSPDETA